MVRYALGVGCFLYICVVSLTEFLEVPYRRSPNVHFHVGASEAKRSEAVLTDMCLLALILSGIFLCAFQFFKS